jgi:hypothetical protein
LAPISILPLTATAAVAASGVDDSCAANVTVAKAHINTINNDLFTFSPKKATRPRCRDLNY